MNERRHAHRYELFIPLQVNAGSANFPQAGTAHLRDISTRGLYFIGEYSIAPGTHLARLVVLDDVDDPTPYWLVSSRHPERVLSALRS